METKILNTLDLVGIAQITGANRLVTRIINRFQFGLTKERQSEFEQAGLDFVGLDKFKGSEFVWVVGGMYANDYTFFDNYAHALHYALFLAGYDIKTKNIDFGE